MHIHVPETLEIVSGDTPRVTKSRIQGRTKQRPLPSLTFCNLFLKKSVLQTSFSWKKIQQKPEVNKRKTEIRKVVTKSWNKRNFPAGQYMFKVNNKTTRTTCEICSKLTKKTTKRRCRFGVFVVNFEHISHLVPLLLLLTITR